MVRFLAASHQPHMNGNRCGTISETVKGTVSVKRHEIRIPHWEPGRDLSVCLRKETGRVSGLVVLTCVLGAEQGGGKREVFSLFSLDEFLTFFKDETKMNNVVSLSSAERAPPKSPREAPPFQSIPGPQPGGYK